MRSSLSEMVNKKDISLHDTESFSDAQPDNLINKKSSKCGFEHIKKESGSRPDPVFENDQKLKHNHTFIKSNIKKEASPIKKVSKKSASLPGNPIKIKDNLDGFDLLGYLVTVPYHCANPKNVTTWLWVNGIVKWWNPKFGRLFVHFIEKDNELKCSDIAGERSWFSAEEDEIRVLSLNAVWNHPVNTCDISGSWRDWLNEQYGFVSQTAIDVCEICKKKVENQILTCLRCKKQFHEDCLDPYDQAEEHRKFVNSFNKKQRRLLLDLENKIILSSSSSVRKKKKNWKAKEEPEFFCDQDLDFEDETNQITTRQLRDRNRLKRIKISSDLDDDDSTSSITNIKQQRTLISKGRVGVSGNSYNDETHVSGESKPTNLDEQKLHSKRLIEKILKKTNPKILTLIDDQMRKSKGKISDNEMIQMTTAIENRLEMNDNISIICNLIREKARILKWTQTVLPLDVKESLTEIEKQGSDSDILSENPFDSQKNSSFTYNSVPEVSNSHSSCQTISDEFWLCKSCQICQYCFEPVNKIPSTIRTEKCLYPAIDAAGNPIELTPTVKCHTCGLMAHGACCFPEVPTLHPQAVWRCHRCCVCRSCGYKDLHWADYTAWDARFEFCFKATERGEYCGVCRKVWDTDDNKGRTQCEICKLWIHEHCDTKLTNASNLEASFPNEISDFLNIPSYRCPICRGTDKEAKHLRILDVLTSLDRRKEFTYPVPKTVISYWRVVKRSMNFSEMKAKVYRRDYNSEDDFLADFMLIIHNAKIVNMPNTRIYRTAMSLEKKGSILICLMLGLSRLVKDRYSHMMDRVTNMARTPPKKKLILTDASQCFDIKQAAQKYVEESFSMDDGGEPEVYLENTADESEEDNLKILKPIVDSRICFNSSKLMYIEDILENINHNPEKYDNSDNYYSFEKSLPLKKPNWNSYFNCLYCIDKCHEDEFTPGLICKSCNRLTHIRCAKIARQFLKGFWQERVYVCPNCSGCIICSLSFDNIGEEYAEKSVKSATEQKILNYVSTTGLMADISAITETTLTPLKLFESNISICISCGRRAHATCLANEPFQIFPDKESVYDQSINSVTCLTLKDLDKLKPDVITVDQTFVLPCATDFDSTHYNHNNSIILKKMIQQRQMIKTRKNHVFLCLQCQQKHMKIRQDKNISYDILNQITIESLPAIISPVVTSLSNSFVSADCVTNDSPAWYPITTNKKSELFGPVIICRICSSFSYAWQYNDLLDLEGSLINIPVLCPKCNKTKNNGSSDEETIKMAISVFEEIRWRIRNTLDIKQLLYSLVDVAPSNWKIDSRITPQMMKSMIKKFMDSAEFLPYRIGEDCCNLELCFFQQLLRTTGPRTRSYLSKLSSYDILLTNYSNICSETVQQKQIFNQKGKEIILEFIRDSLKWSERSNAHLQNELREYCKHNEHIFNEDINFQLIAIVKKCLSWIYSQPKESEEILTLHKCFFKLPADIDKILSLNIQNKLSYEKYIIFSQISSCLQDLEETGSDYQCSLCQKNQFPTLGYLIPVKSPNLNVEFVEYIHSECLLWSFSYSSRHHLDLQNILRDFPYYLEIDIGVVLSLLITAEKELCFFCNQKGATIKIYESSRSHLFCLFKFLPSDIYIDFIRRRVFQTNNQRALMCRDMEWGLPLYFSAYLNIPIKIMRPSHKVDNFKEQIQKYFQRAFVPIHSKKMKSCPDNIFSVTKVSHSYFDSSVYHLISLGSIDHQKPDIKIPVGFSSMRKYPQKSFSHIEGSAALFWDIYLCCVVEDNENPYKIYIDKNDQWILVSSGFTVHDCVKPIAPDIDASIFFGLNHPSALIGCKAINYFQEKSLSVPLTRANLTEIAKSYDIRKLNRSMRAWIWAFITPPRPRPLRELGHPSNSLGTFRSTDWRTVFDARGICIFNDNDTETSFMEKTETTELRPSRSSSRSVARMRPEKISNSIDHRYVNNNLILYLSGISALSTQSRVCVKLSRIHGLGLFTTCPITKGEPVIEYVGDLIRNVIADKREAFYSAMGDKDASCYMFRLTESLVVDATTAGNTARFINHSCIPNCVCRIVSGENKTHHIIIVASVDIPKDQEVTYDYKFNVEEESRKIICQCGSSNCLGRMN